MFNFLSVMKKIDIFNILKSGGLRFDSQKVEKILVNPDSTDEADVLRIRNLVHQMRVRYLQVHRIEKLFLQRNKDWLQSSFECTILIL